MSYRLAPRRGRSNSITSVDTANSPLHGFHANALNIRVVSGEPQCLSSSKLRPWPRPSTAFSRRPLPTSGSIGAFAPQASGTARSRRSSEPCGSGGSRGWATRNRRVLFFCSCDVVRMKCHRFVVATLLLEAARARKTRLTVVEWPGGSPEYRQIRIPASSMKTGRSTVPIGAAFPRNGLATLPWGSQVEVQNGRESRHVVTGPASFKGQWTLPVLEAGDAEDPTARSLEDMGAAFRADYGCDEQHSWGPSLLARPTRQRRPR